MLHGLMAAIFTLVGVTADGVICPVCPSSPGQSFAGQTAALGHLCSEPAKFTHQVSDAAVSRDPFPFSNEAKGEEGSTVGQAEPRPLKISRAFTNSSANSFSHACSLKAHRDCCPNWPSSKLSTQIAFCVWRS